MASSRSWIGRALLFDLDGTLIETGGLYERHWRAWGAARGIDGEAIVAVHFGRPAAETIRLVAPELDADAEAARYNADLAADPDTGGVIVVEGAMELLAAIPAGRWAIVTSAARVMVDRWLDVLGLPLPAALVTVDDVERGKPAPDPFLLAAARLGVAAADCLVVEDAPAGVAAGKAAGCTVLAVGSTHAQADLAAADFHVPALSGLHVTAEAASLRVRW